MTTELGCLLFLALWSLVLVYAPATGKLLYAGVSWGVGNRDTEPLAPSWVSRADRAARNHYENLPVFAIVVLVAHLVGVHDDVTRGAAVFFVAARVAHAVAYWSGVGPPRTVAYYLSVGALAAFVSRLF